MPLASGTKLGAYEILSTLGAGGMGEVYRARDTRLERTVAIRILPPQLSNDPVRKQRFEREAKTISNLNHPHICVLHDVGSQDGVDYLVMECVEGETLAERLEKGSMPLEQVLKFGGQIADALDVVPFPGPGGKWQVSPAGGCGSRWRRDGKEIFYISIDNKVMATEVKSSGSSFEIGSTHELFATRPYGVFGRFDVSADGQRFVIPFEAGQPSAAITLVVNWPAELKKK